jgi:hypothetical protein
MKGANQIRFGLLLAGLFTRVLSKPLMIHDNPNFLIKTAKQHGMGTNQRAIKRSIQKTDRCPESDL